MPEKHQTRVAESESRRGEQPAAAWAAQGKPPRGVGDHTGSILAIQSVVVIAVILTICYFAKLVLVTLLVSILLAYVLEPVVSLLSRFKLPRPVAAAMALLLLGGILYGAVYFGYSKGIEFVQELPKYSGKI